MWELEIRRKAALFCNAVLSMLHCSFSLAAAQLLVKMTSALQKKPMLQCNFCSAAFRKLHFRLWHVAGVEFRWVGFRTCWEKPLRCVEPQNALIAQCIAPFECHGKSLAIAILSAIYQRIEKTLSFLSSFVWRFLVFFSLARNSLVFFSFFPFFSEILGVWLKQDIFVFFGGCPFSSQKNKEKKDREQKKGNVWDPEDRSDSDLQLRFLVLSGSFRCCSCSCSLVVLLDALFALLQSAERVSMWQLTRMEGLVVHRRWLRGPISRDIAILVLRYPISRDTSEMCEEPQPPHTRQKHEQTSGKLRPQLQKKKGKPTLSSHICVHIFALYVGVGVAKRFPNTFSRRLALPTNGAIPPFGT